ncbi:hypothetical protein PoB_005790600 [Plakobranchus ocellatus]|uniref:Uncharacterized protein n=1 Tax=Plakobranchus ocellatus TaxID=259542 RepID=A0AAV4CF49_9GAST|nr:hypothetical protein PoB_005790600 [Plakobranchus ocellatus]
MFGRQRHQNAARLCSSVLFAISSSNVNRVSCTEQYILVSKEEESMPPPPPPPRTSGRRKAEPPKPLPKVFTRSGSESSKTPIVAPRTKKN